MPRQGNTVESCIIVGWKVAEGQAVSASLPVCEVETDKASFEVPAGAEGIVLKILHPAGDDVPVLQPIAVIGRAGEDWAASAGGVSAGQANPATAAGAVPVPESGSRTGSATIAIPEPSTEVLPGFSSPRARNLARAEGLSLTGIGGTGPGGRIIERDVKAALDDRPALTAGARAEARRGGALPIAGTALGGRVGVADFAAGSAPKQAATVAAPAESAPAEAFRSASPGPASSGETAAFPGAFVDTPVKGIRRIIADRMRASLSQTAQLTLNASASAQAMLALRARFKGGSGGAELAGVTIGDLVLAAVARILPKFPALNAHMKGDSIRSFERVHLGLAVDTPRGLMVPVIRNADTLSLARLSAEAKRLAAACIGGTIQPDDLVGSTFTVTNLGAFGIESFTPVLNTPEVGILGLCSITDRPVAAGSSLSPGTPGQACVEKRIGLSLTIDHQAVDGALGAKFLQALGAALADIDLFLLK
jgi:pyruvate dehydrogenase E2 component (dihydrolipoamide acetyltransferase)